VIDRSTSDVQPVFDISLSEIPFSEGKLICIRICESIVYEIRRIFYSSQTLETVIWFNNCCRVCLKYHIIDGNSKLIIYYHFAKQNMKSLIYISLQ
jgi:hypothetical protein